MVLIRAVALTEVRQRRISVLVRYIPCSIASQYSSFIIYLHFMEDSKAWLEGMAETFEVALGTGNYVECKEIIQSLRDEGFEVEAKQAHNALMEETS